MKKTVIISIVILLLSLLSPDTLVAATSDSNKESEEEIDADADSESGDDENTSESEQREEQDNDNDGTESNSSSDSDSSDKNDSEKGTNTEDNIEDDDSTSGSDNSKEDDNSEAEAKDEESQEDDDDDSSVSEKKKDETDSETKENNEEQKSEKEANTLTTSSKDIGIKTSKLGHIKSTSVKIYQTPESSTSTAAGEEYTNAVYYIKRQVDIDGDRFYLISEKASAEDGTVGWVQEDDLTLNDHERVDTKKKTKYFTGKGSAYSKAWGGSQDSEYEDMSDYQSEAFHINKTEKVGSNTWYRGKFDGKTIWLHESYLTSKEKDKTSKLGHFKDKQGTIYETIGDRSTTFTAGEKYINQVYYIKQEAKVDEQMYYLISLKPSSDDEVVGWVKEDDLTLNDHERVDTKKKTKYFTGKGSAYSKAWGGSQDSEYEDMSDYQSEAFHINKTEKVGSNTWYRGKFDGKTIWLHESYLTSKEKDKTSKLGHFKDKQGTIYETIGDRSTTFTAGEKYINQVYYIKQEAKVDEQMYYLISLKPSSDDEVVGWVKEDDLTLNDHERVDTKKKTKYFTGKGSAYSKAWGGSQDSEYEDMSDYQSEPFHINKTEKVGSNTWYRGKFDGKTIWLHESYLEKGKEVDSDATTYDLTLDKMTDIQMKANPQTDKGNKLWIREDAINNISNGKGTVKGDNWNLRRGPGTNYPTEGQVNNGDKLDLKSSKKVSGYTWYHVRNTSGWVSPDKSDLQYYLDYKNFDDSLKDELQFLKLSESANISASEVNEKILKGNGILEGKAEAFADGSQKHGVNEMYLIAHALLETGNGTSDLAKGKVKHKGKKVYNMYGIGADDENPKKNGAKYAYDAGWFTPEDAIKGGAEFVSQNYIQEGQDTLYKMRWNPLGAANNGTATHQYASDIGWAYKQSKNMYDMYNLLDNYNMMLDIPKYQ